MRPDRYEALPLRLSTTKTPRHQEEAGAATWKTWRLGVLAVSFSGLLREQGTRERCLRRRPLSTSTTKTPRHQKEGGAAAWKTWCLGVLVVSLEDRFGTLPNSTGLRGA